jgi:preprotein translocase subunit SecA
MTEEEENLIEKISCRMYGNNSYTYSLFDLLHICKVYKIKCTSKKLESLLKKEIISDYPCIMYNEDSDTYSKVNKKIEDKSTVNMAKLILKMTLEENKKNIQKWIDTQFEDKLNKAVQSFVSSEFKKEILPVILNHIDKKIEDLKSTSKSDVQKCIKDLVSDIWQLVGGHVK